MSRKRASMLLEASILLYCAALDPPTENILVRKRNGPFVQKNSL